MSSPQPMDLWFQSMLRWERLANFSPDLKKQMEADLLSASHELTELSSVQKHGATALLGAAYQVFGFSILGPLGRGLLGQHLLSRCGIPLTLSSVWLESTAFNLLEDLNVLQVVCGEPDWALVDLGLATDIWQRVFCSDEQERDLLGLDVLDPSHVAAFRHHAASALRDMRSQGVATPKASAAAGFGAFEWPAVLRDTFLQVSQTAESNPLRLLLWRVQGVSQIQETRHEVKFILRVPDPMHDDDARHMLLAGALVWLLISLSPFQAQEAKSADVDPPWPWSVLATRLGADRARGHFSGAGIELPTLSEGAPPVLGKQIPSGTGPYANAQDAKGTMDLAEVVRLARDLGLVFEIVPRPGKPAYGLTSSGLRILAPFEALIKEWLALPGAEGSEAKDSRAIREPQEADRKRAQPRVKEPRPRAGRVAKSSALLRKVG